MPEERAVICNTIPLLYLHRIGQLDLLKKLYGRVYIPVQVVDELKAGGAGTPDIETIDWMDIKCVSVPASLLMVPDLGLGECGVIALALTLPSSLVFIDDGLGRKIAQYHKLSVTGTAGAMLKAKEKGLISSVRPLFEDIIREGFYLREEHYEMLCQIAGE